MVPHISHLTKRKEKRQQIGTTRAKSQQIVAQRPLSCVQYPVVYLSRIQRICLSQYLNLLFGSVWLGVLFLTVPSPLYDLGPEGLCLLIITLGKLISPLSSMDSGLEAFSRNPTHGSFSALTFPSTEFTNYVNQRFLSYWIGLLLRRQLHQ